MIEVILGVLIALCACCFYLANSVSDLKRNVILLNYIIDDLIKEDIKKDDNANV